jgi:hypothetical protein
MEINSYLFILGISLIIITILLIKHKVYGLQRIMHRNEDEKDDNLQIFDYPLIRFIRHPIATIKINLLFIMEAFTADFFREAFVDTIDTIDTEGKITLIRTFAMSITILFYIIKITLIGYTIYSFLYVDDSSWILFLMSLIAVEFIYFAIKSLIRNKIKGIISCIVLFAMGNSIIFQIKEYYDKVYYNFGSEEIKLLANSPEHPFITNIVKILYGDVERYSLIAFHYYYHIVGSFFNFLDYVATHNALIGIIIPFIVFYLLSLFIFYVIKQYFYKIYTV